MFLLIWTKNLCVQNKSYFLMALKMKWNEKLIFFLFWFIKCSLAGGFLLINLLCHDKFLLNFSFFILLTYLYFLLCDENLCDSNWIFFPLVKMNRWRHWKYLYHEHRKYLVLVISFVRIVTIDKLVDMIWRHEENCW